MIYLHRLIYAILFPIFGLLALVIMIMTLILASPFYLFIYYIKHGYPPEEIQVENFCQYPAYPIFKFLHFIEP